MINLHYSMWEIMLLDVGFMTMTLPVLALLCFALRQGLLELGHVSK